MPYSAETGKKIGGGGEKKEHIIAGAGGKQKSRKSSSFGVGKGKREKGVFFVLSRDDSEEPAWVR